METATAKNARFYWTRNFAKNQNPDLQDSKRQFETQLIFAKRLKDLTKQTPNGERYLRWGGRRNAVQTENGWGRETAEKRAESPASSARFVGQFLW